MGDEDDPGPAGLPVLATTSARLSACHDDEVDDVLRECLDHAGPRLGLVSVTVWLADDPAGPLEQRSTWVADRAGGGRGSRVGHTVLVPTTGAGRTQGVVEIVADPRPGLDPTVLEVLAGLVGQAVSRRERVDRPDDESASASVSPERPAAARTRTSS